MSDDPRNFVRGGWRCALQRPSPFEDWWFGTSPRNGDGAFVEGPWEDWVALARGILAADEKWRAMQPTHAAASGPSQAGEESA